MNPERTLQDDPQAGRQVRMLTMLAAGCDPCGWVDTGRSPNLYAGVALDALKRIRVGAEPVDLVMALPGDADAGAGLRFALAAITWWNGEREQATRRLDGALSA